VVEWLLTGFGLVIGFIGHVQLVSTINYNSFANCHTSQFAIARDYSSQSSLALPGNGSSGSVFSSLHPRWRYFTADSTQLSTELQAKTAVFIKPRHRPHRKHRLQRFLYCCMRIHCRGNDVFTEPLLINVRLVWLHNYYFHFYLIFSPPFCLSSPLCWKRNLKVYTHVTELFVSVIWRLWCHLWDARSNYVLSECGMYDDSIFLKVCYFCECRRARNWLLCIRF
jgi:hypothetical protein